MLHYSTSKIVLFLFPLLTIFFVACDSSSKEKQLKKSKEVQSQIEGIKMANQKQEEELILIEEEKRKNNRADELLQWLQGNWEWSGYIDGSYYSFRLGFSDDYAVLATPRGVYDQGKLTIDYDENKLYFGNTYFDFDYENGKLGVFSEGTYYRKMSKSSTATSSSYLSGSTSNSTITFRTSSDVMAYVSNRFRNSVGNVITIKYDGLYTDGKQSTNAVRVVQFEGSRARLTATSPYTQGTLYFTVDASRGTFTDGSGDVFYKL